MALNTGDVVRLGRVCYIVKENSIDLSEKAIEALENYAQDKHDQAWDKLWQKLGGGGSPPDEASAYRLNNNHQALIQQ